MSTDKFPMHAELSRASDSAYEDSLHLEFQETFSSIPSPDVRTKSKGLRLTSSGYNRSSLAIKVSKQEATWSPNDFKEHLFPLTSLPTSEYPPPVIVKNEYPKNQFPDSRFPAGDFPNNGFPRINYPIAILPENAFPPAAYPRSHFPESGIYPGV
ncbi:hypothetical protein Bpfe_020919 [Biomphalaria pfeifferi]|uniref:Uncharacterized protein n=1 Tax=Biomphalaria pfeifferi TaxID=112525 RepID=A0AAD8B9C1_BIOPF|nr:hypothetical protein Bpfe_020919 [Biomphalaria pfeifferi]